MEILQPEILEVDELTVLLRQVVMSYNQPL